MTGSPIVKLPTLFLKNLLFTLQKLQPIITINDLEGVLGIGFGERRRQFGFQFELVRLQDDLQFWTVLFSWVVVTILLNRLVWKRGLKRYESVG
jgi:hypothetical protein